MTQNMNFEKMGFAELYRSVPARNSAARARKTGEGIIIETPVAKPIGARRLLSWIAPGPARGLLSLDQLGESVFNECNGRNTARDIIEHFALEHRLSFIEARTLVVMFLKQLMERGAIVAIIEK